ncbi:MAG: polysaccharide lyase family 7 protein [Reichenbachiella sp.]|uniref:polysaccharide lyase family 7 protein n=1 Tax=Reichenbachiella sp. TaxID=2184521 RepID=UPI003263EBB2
MRNKPIGNHSGHIALSVTCMLIWLLACQIVVAQSNNDYLLPNIDLSHWKVTLPIGQGKPVEVEPPEILDYASIQELKPFMYNDSTDASLVFYTYPGAVTGNTKYSRTELREQMTPGSNKVNWTFEQGARMKGTLAVAEISKTSKGKFDRTIVMQIHGRLTNEQKESIGQNDNNAPPVLKIYWHNGYIRVKTKELKDINGIGKDLLPKEAWEDDKGYNFPEYVGNKPFTLEVIVTKGRLEVILNEKTSKVYQGIHMRKWGVFENYFKAGNYLQTKNPNGFAKVKYYALEISHSDITIPEKRKKKKRKANE